MKPLTPANCDLRDFPRLMLDIPRLRASSFDATSNDSAWRAGVNLWLASWHSVPAGSLENTEEALVKAAELGRDVRTWRKLSAIALRNWVECEDGRLYHPTVCEIALESWLEKLKQRLSSRLGNATRWGGAFDGAPIEAEIDHSIGLLKALNPANKALAKVIEQTQRRRAGAIPPGPKNAPTGTPERSHRDRKSVPYGSQETGTGNVSTNPGGGDHSDASGDPLGDGPRLSVVKGGAA